MNTPTPWQILTHTPVWVFALVAGLVALGVVQSRNRTATLGRLLIAPVALSALSLQSVWTSFASNLPALALWPIVACVTAFFLLRLGVPAGTRYDATAKIFTIAGSWTPMVLFMGIFLVKYAVGVSLAIRPQLAQTMSFALPICALNGAFSGIFMARAIRWWQMTRAA